MSNPTKQTAIVKPEILSDDSVVYSVTVVDDCETSTFRFGCKTEADAKNLADIINGTGVSYIAWV